MGLTHRLEHVFGGGVDCLVIQIMKVPCHVMGVELALWSDVRIHILYHHVMPVPVDWRHESVLEVGDDARR